MSKTSRQSKILHIINTKNVETQEELVEQLRASSFAITQATISRDIKELNLVKTMTAGGKYKYSVMQDANTSLNSKTLNIFRETVLNVLVAVNLVVVKTMNGCASTVATIVEQLNIVNILGIVGGTDTLLIICADEQQASLVASQLNDLLKSN